MGNLGNMGNQAGLNCKSHPLWHPLSSPRFFLHWNVKCSTELVLFLDLMVGNEVNVA